jgi:hypothetical protein
MRLYRSRDLPEKWVGEDPEGALMVWPAKKRGWSRRTAYVGPRRALEEVEPALARGTGWPGGGRAHHPRSPSGRPSRPVSVRATEEERAAWAGAAKRARRTLSEWCREALNAAAERASKPVATAPPERQR